MNEIFLKKFDSDEEDEEYIPTQKELNETEEPKIIKQKANKSKVEDLWEKLKKGNKEVKIEKDHNDDLKNADDKEIKSENKTINEDVPVISASKQESNLDDEILKAINKAKEMKNKTITETIHFAGQKFEYNKMMTQQDEKKMKDKEKKKTHSGLDSLVESLEKKGNVNTLTKTKKDWENFVETKKIQKELDYNRKDGFLQKKQFIEETNARLLENKKSIKKPKTDI